MGLTLVSQGCLATKKNVQQQIAPVQAQVNQVQKQAAENKQAIGDLDRQVASVDEKAVEAARKAQEAADAARRANEAAAHANDAANQAGQKADAAKSTADQVGAKLDKAMDSLDNYHLQATQKVYFGSGRSNLSKDEEEKLDQTIQSLASVKYYVIEVEGFTDPIGGAAYNLALSQRRADAVQRYLTLHDVPLRKIHVVGVGKEDPKAVNKTRADRKENRRVDVRIYALDLAAKN
ncbi:MAG TPA: OmpA family protein [Bryobacteraceae bacterium]|nr:OmpA family protein [Bryobacteraceae bacterium]